MSPTRPTDPDGSSLPSPPSRLELARPSPDPQARQEPLPRGLHSRHAAADFLGLSLRHFDRIKHGLTAVLVGSRKKLYALEDLLRWVDMHKVGSSKSARSPRTTTSGSGTTASAAMSPRENEILQQLRRKPRASTPRLFPVGEQSSKREPNETQ